MKTIEDIKSYSKKHPIILFDGECIFCVDALQFFIKIDKAKILRFTTLQSDIGKALKEKLKLDEDNESVILVDNGEFYTQTDVTFRTMSHLNYPWRALAILKYIPKTIRDFFYNIIAKNRYKWFGKRDQCFIPSTEQKHLFIL